MDVRVILGVIAIILIFSALYCIKKDEEIFMYVCCIFIFIAIFFGAIVIGISINNALEKHVLKNNIAVDYEELNSRLYEIAGFIVIEQIEQDEKSNEYYEKIIEKINSYNERINYYLEKYNKYNITIPQELEKFQLLYYNYADNTVYWKDDTLFKLN